MTVFSLLRIQLHQLSYRIGATIQGVPCSVSFALSLTFCCSGKVSLDRMTEFLHKTALLDSYADNPPHIVDVPTTTQYEDIGFKNATFSWSVESPSCTSTPSNRTFRLHIAGEQLFKHNCINLIIGPT